METNENIRRALATWYRTGDAKPLVGLLTEWTRWESMWVMVPMVGKQEIGSYLWQKGRVFVSTGSVDEMHCYAASNGGLYCTQQLEDGEVAILVMFTVDGGGMLERVDICRPELYRFTKAGEYVRSGDGQGVEYQAGGEA